MTYDIRLPIKVQRPKSCTDKFLVTINVKIIPVNTLEIEITNAISPE